MSFQLFMAEYSAYTRFASGRTTVLVRHIHDGLPTAARPVRLRSAHARKREHALSDESPISLGCGPDRHGTPGCCSCSTACSCCGWPTARSWPSCSNCHRVSRGWRPYAYPTISFCLASTFRRKPPAPASSVAATKACPRRCSSRSPQRPCRNARFRAPSLRL